MQNVQNTFTFTDLNSVQNIKYDAKRGEEGEDKALKKIAKQFESIMLNMMLKSMRDANNVFAEGNFMNSFEMKHHQEMMDHQMALSLSEGKGLGLADTLYMQMKQQYNLAKPDEFDKSHHFMPVDKKEPMPLADSRRAVSQLMSSMLSGKDSGNASEKKPALDINAINFKPVTPVDAASETVASPESFVKTLYPVMEKFAKPLGIDPKIMLAQSALETGWGKHVVPNTKNLFNIKSNNQWQGESVAKPTLEFYSELPVLEKAWFKKYDSFESSVQDYLGLMQGSRYQDALKLGNSPQQFLEKIQDSGYATDPDYSKKIMQVMRSGVFKMALSGLKDIR